MDVARCEVTHWFALEVLCSPEAQLPLSAILPQPSKQGKLGWCLCSAIPDQTLA